MYWRMIVIIILLVGSSYIVGQRSSSAEKSSSRAENVGMASADNIDANTVNNDQPIDVSFSPDNVPTSVQIPVSELASAGSQPAEREERFTLDIQQESQRIAATAGIAIASIQVTDKLPAYAPMAMTFRRGNCVLLINNNLPLDALMLTNISAYGRRQITFTLGHETGHCYVMTEVARRNPAILPSLSPPGKGYSFEQYIAMMGRYDEYPDLNRWNEEWADTFSAFILSRAYGKEFAMAVTSERFALRKNQEKNGSVLMSNVYGGHASLTEEALFTIQSPLEIANLVKLGRLNTSR